MQSNLFASLVSHLVCNPGEAVVEDGMVLEVADSCCRDKALEVEEDNCCHGKVWEVEEEDNYCHGKVLEMVEGSCYHDMLLAEDSQCC